MSGSRDDALCAEMGALLHALADGELDAANALRCEAHLGRCGRCAAAFAEIRTVRDALRREAVRYAAPERLRARILAEVEVAAPEAQPRAVPAPGWLQRPLAVAAAAVSTATAAVPRAPWAWRRAVRPPAFAFAAGLAAALLIAPLLPGDDAVPGVRQEVVAGHVRSLLAAGSHLTDVPSSDQHTVKPWFAGRLDFAPPTPDLSDAGFQLAGGRLDYIGGRPVAALVYRRRGHVINVFVWPEATARRADSGTAARGDGHAVRHWTQGGLAFWAVSDLNAAELADFARLFGARAQEPASSS